MRKKRFMLRLALVMLLVFGAFWTWQTPGWLWGPLTLDEVDYHLEQVEKNLAMPPGKNAEVISRLRAWALADDGRPVYVLNLMRYYPQVLAFDGAPAFDGTPQQSNALYEQKVTPVAFSIGAYPLFLGPVQGDNLLEQAAELDNWSRVILMRYPSRRAVLELFSDPRYAPWEPYKLMALRVLLVPVQAQVLLPELRWLVGGVLLLLFLLIGWVRAARRAA